MIAVTIFQKKARNETTVSSVQQNTKGRTPEHRMPDMTPEQQAGKSPRYLSCHQLYAFILQGTRKKLCSKTTVLSQQSTN
jgi:hypothetical protein